MLTSTSDNRLPISLLTILRVAVVNTRWQIAHVPGWENVIVIDDDLGRSGGGTARPGFERLLAAICTCATGAVLAIEASRLARNGRDWHTLLEFCTLVNTLIIDKW